MKMQQKIDTLISLYRTNTLNDEQAQTLAAWLQESDEHRQYFKRYLAAGRVPASEKAEQEWARFAARNKILFNGSVRRPSTWQRVRGYAAAAAVVTAAVCSVWFWDGGYERPRTATMPEFAHLMQPLEYSTSHGERLNIALPDGSTVCLNSDAKLIVASDFGRATREIQFDGEGFFNITPNPGCPFIIHSADNDFTVLGTSFNLQSYAKEDFAVVTLHTGCLQAQVKKDVIVLAPNQELQIDASTNTISKREVDVDNSIGWIDGRLVFAGHPLKDVVNKLSRYYQVKVSVHDDIANQQYTGIVDKESLTEALRMICATSPVKLSITDIDGVYFLSRAKRK